MMHVTQTRFGGPETLSLAETPAPLPGPGQILVRMAAAGLNPVDAGVREGLYPLLGEPPFTLGWDLAGRVEALGVGVTGFALGQRVMGMPFFPGPAATHAELVLAPAAEMIAIPEAMSDAEAGALPLAGLTAWQALVGTAELQPGQRVLIHGGAGGVGHLAIQIAKARGAHVTATVSPAKRDIAARLGADTVLDYTRDDLGSQPAFDVILDPLGGSSHAASLALTRKGGITVALMPVEDHETAAAVAEGKRLVRILVAPSAADLQALADLAAAGRLTVLIAGAFPLARAAEAHALLAAKPVGKVVLIP